MHTSWDFTLSLSLCLLRYKVVDNQVRFLRTGMARVVKLLYFKFEVRFWKGLVVIKDRSVIDVVPNLHKFADNFSGRGKCLRVVLLRGVSQGCKQLQKVKYMELHIDYWRTSMIRVVDDILVTKNYYNACSKELQYTMQIITCIYLVPVCIVQKGFNLKTV